MAGNVTREEFKELEGRVEVLEGEVEGEKRVTRHILEQTRRNGDNLAAVKSRLDRVESEVRGLREDLPSIVGDTMRAVLRERDGE